MNRATLARRYGPLAVVVAVQLLIIAAVPSKAPNESHLAAGAGGPSVGAAVPASGGGGEVATTGTVPSGGTAAGATTASTAAGGGGGAAAPTGKGGTTSAAQGATGRVQAASAAAGDTAHCVAGRTFDPGLAYFSPPCVPGTPGGAYPDNGGNTAPGVTKDSVTIVDYVSNYGAEVNAILQAEGLLVTYDDAKKVDAAYENFLNSKFVFYGRHLKIVTYAGQCTSVPPDKQCLIPEMDKIVDTYHPFMVFWNTTLCSECYAELARKKTIATGGIGFSEKFASSIAPFFYSASQSATRMETAFAEFWCKQLQPGPVKFAGTSNPLQNFNGKPRVLGVISTNDPDNEDTVKSVLYPLLDKCGQHVTHEYFYDQNINTAAQQVQAGNAAMNTPSNPATTVLCLCDAVAPQFLYEGQTQNNYHPENVLADVQYMDYDSTGQSYEQKSDGSATLACPTPPNCEFDRAFGLVADSPQQSQNDDEGIRIYHAGGGQGAPPITGVLATRLAAQWVMMAGLIQNAGPNLTPDTVHEKATAMGTIGGGAGGQAMYGFVKQPGGDINYNWQLDARVVYWDKHAKSSYNGAPGTFVSIEGTRFDVGKYPNMPDGPPIPANR